MKLSEVSVDEEKENSCNRNGISNKIPTDKLPEKQSTLEEIPSKDSGSNNVPLGPGDLLVEDLNVTRNRSEDGFQNGNKGDDSASNSDSSSNFPVTDMEDDLEDEMTLRLSDEEDTEPTTSEFNFTPPSMPPATSSEISDAKQETVVENKTDAINNDLEKDSDKVLPIENPVLDQKDDDKLNANNDETCSNKSDDNLESFISDMNEQSKTILETETEGITISDLRQEIEDFIKNHDNDETPSESIDNLQPSTESLNDAVSSKIDDSPKETLTEDCSETSVEEKHSLETNKEDNENSNSEKIDEINKNNSETLENNNNAEQVEILSTQETMDIDQPNTEETSDSLDTSFENNDKINTTESESETVKIDIENCLNILNNELNDCKEENETDSNENQSEINCAEAMEIDIVENKVKFEEKSVETSNCVDEIENSKEIKDEIPSEIPKEKDHDKIIVEENSDNVVEETNETRNDLIEQENIVSDDLKGLEEVEKSEDERIALKRTLESDDDAHEVKKAKMNDEVLTPKKEYVSLNFLREFMAKKEIKSLNRVELEELCLQKICEAIGHTSKIGQLNRLIRQQSQVMETLRNKCTALTKQVCDLEVVQSRLFQEVRTKSKIDGTLGDVTPVKITRSVGLQVSLPTAQSRIRQPPVEPPPKRRTQRLSLPNKLYSTTTPATPMGPPNPPAPLNKSPNNASKGIKTLLPRVLNGTETKDKQQASPTVLGTYLQKQNSSNTSSVSANTSGKKSSSPTVSSPSVTSETTTKVIDLTDEDDTQKSSSSSGIRVVSSHQLTNPTTSSVTSLPRVTYLVQGAAPGQQVLLTTSTATTRPGQIRPTIMLKPVSAGQVGQGQRLNLVRPNSVPGLVLPATSNSVIRPGQSIRLSSAVQNTRPQTMTSRSATRHPAPLPGPPAVQASQSSWKAMPPKPSLKISRVGDGIVLSWKMLNKDMSLYEEIASYQLYAYQETNAAPSTDMWRKVGDVKALALPMACTLTQFTDGNKYHFAVRAVDVKSRVGPFSPPEQISLP